MKCIRIARVNERMRKRSREGGIKHSHRALIQSRAYELERWLSQRGRPCPPSAVDSSGACDPPMKLFQLQTLKTRSLCSPPFPRRVVGALLSMSHLCSSGGSGRHYDGSLGGIRDNSKEFLRCVRGSAESNRVDGQRPFGTSCKGMVGPDPLHRSNEEGSDYGN